MAMFKNGNSVGGIRKVAKKRALVRKILLEGLERRELMAVDSAAPVFAPGTPQEYVNEWINRLKAGNGQQSGEGNSGNFEVGNRRWSNPTGGGSTNQGDTATVSWSIVPDGTRWHRSSEQLDCIYGRHLRQCLWPCAKPSLVPTRQKSL
jgi:hypothetical protein